MGQIGKAVGPDLTSIAKRFTRKEALESIMFPSHVISDQYATKRVLTTDGKVLSGILSTNTDGSITVRDSNLRETVVAEQDIDQVPKQGFADAERSFRYADGRRDSRHDGLPWICATSRSRRSTGCEASTQGTLVRQF